MALLLLTAAGVGTLLAALNVAYRDVRHAIPFLLQFGMFATPAIYMETSLKPADSAEVAAAADPADAESAAPPVRHRASGVPGWVKQVLQFNPMIGLISFFRAAVLGGPLDWPGLMFSATISGLIFLTGCLYFRRVEDTFADII
jgi:lipopolysaccharide transport system permease protein